MRRAALLTGILILLLAPAAVRAQEAAAPEATPRLEKLVPDSTFFYASLNDIPSCRAQFSRSALGKLWREPEVQAFLEPGLKWIEARLSEAEEKIGRSLRDIPDFFQGQAALAVVSWDPMMGNPVPDAVVLVDLGAKREAFREIHRELIEKAGARVGAENVTFRDVPVQLVTLPEGVTLGVAYLGNALVLTTGRERMEAVIDAWKDGLPASLAADGEYRAVRGKTGGKNASLSAFLNVKAVLAHFANVLPPMAMTALEKSGLDGLKAVGFGSTFVAEGVRDTLYLHMPGEKRGFLGLFYTSPGTVDEMLARIPANAFYASAGRVDLGKAMDIILETAGEIQPMIAAQLSQGISWVESRLGVSIREDILGPLGDGLAVYAALPGDGGLVPDLVLMGRLDDPKRFLAAMEELCERAKSFAAERGRLVVELRRLEIEGKEIHYLHVAQTRGDPFPVTPCWMVDGKTFLMALYPQVLKDIAARGKDFRSILERPDFRRVMKGLPEGLTSVEYVDLNAAVRLVYGSLVPLAQMFGNHARCPLDLALLPRTETVAKHLFGAAWGMKLGDQGVTIHAYSPAGVLSLVGAGTALAAVVWVSEGGEAVQGVMRPGPGKRWKPGHGRVRVIPPVKTGPAKPGPAANLARDRLKAIYNALLYHYVETGEYPADLGELLESKALSSPRMLVVPGTTLTTTKSGRKTSFDYTGPKTGHLLEKPGRAVWVYQHAAAGGRRWVLFGSGEVRRVPEKEFQDLLAATSARLAK